MFSEVCKKDSKNRERGSLIRRICFISAQCKFRFFVEWVERDHNEYADALSKCDISRFKKLCKDNNREFSEHPMCYARPTGLSTTHDI